MSLWGILGKRVLAESAKNHFGQEVSLFSFLFLFLCMHSCVLDPVADEYDGIRTPISSKFRPHA